MEELLPAGIGAQMALNQQKVALSVIKSTANSQQAIADMVMEGARTAAANASRGTRVNFSV